MKYVDMRYETGIINILLLILVDPENCERTITKVPFLHYCDRYIYMSRYTSVPQTDINHFNDGFIMQKKRPPETA
jgi:hypothetical protein